MSLMPPFRSFASDNNAGIHPAILQAIANANADHALGYGDDVYTQRAIAKFKEHLGEDIEVYFVFNGTGANVIALSAICQPYHAVICAETAHINVDECGAPEKFAGCKLIDVPTRDGKLTVDLIAPHIRDIGVEHHVQARAVSITQSTELGTVYTPNEVRAIADFVHAQGLLLHMDGARICNAAAALGCGLREITRDCGVDVLSFGGTKNGLMLGEAVIFFPSPGRGGAGGEVKFIRKQAMQLASKMRFVAAQFEALLSNDLWLHNARHANQMAQKLGAGVAQIPAIALSRPVQANAVFAMIPRMCIAPLQEQYFFYVWDEAANEVRWMTSFDTTDEDVESFLNVVARVLDRKGDAATLQSS
jgi:threonine aldolase